MIVRKRQMDVFDGLAEESFIHRIAQHIRTTHPDCVSGYDNQFLLELVTAGVTRGRRHGLTWESSLTTFVALMFVIAPNFDAQAHARSILKDQQTPADHRIDRVVDELTDREWEEAREQSDSMAWFAAE